MVHPTCEVALASPEVDVAEWEVATRSVDSAVATSSRHGEQKQEKHDNVARDPGLKLW